MRFFVDDQGATKLPQGVAGEGATPPVISLYRTRNGAELVDLDPAAMRGIIEQDFEHVDPRFHSFQEGHVEQPGTLVMETLFVETMADREYYHGRFVAFEPAPMSGSPETLRKRLAAQANAAGPSHAAAYEETFYLTEPGVLYAKPSDTSDRITELEAHKQLIKVRTVDDDWYEVHVAADETTRGFVRRDAVTAVN
jgi:hypothetical protein